MYIAIQPMNTLTKIWMFHGFLCCEPLLGVVHTEEVAWGDGEPLLRQQCSRVPSRASVPDGRISAVCPEGPGPQG